MVDSWLESLLCLSLHLLSSLLLVVLSLHVLKFSGKSFNLILVLIDLCLIHVELSSHCFHLTCLFFQVLLIDRQLLGNLWSWLSCKKILKLNIELFFLLNDNVFFNNFFSFFDESLLECLDLVKHFPSIWISTLKLSPSMTIQWILKLFRKCFNLESFSQKLLLETVNLFSQIWNLGCL